MQGSRAAHWARASCEGGSFNGHEALSHDLPLLAFLSATDDDRLYVSRVSGHHMIPSQLDNDVQAPSPSTSCHLHACSPASSSEQWAELEEGVLLLTAQHLPPYALAKARLVCRAWRQVFKLAVTSIKLQVVEAPAALTKLHPAASTPSLSQPLRPSVPGSTSFPQQPGGCQSPLAPQNNQGGPQHAQHLQKQHLQQPQQQQQALQQQQQQQQQPPPGMRSLSRSSFPPPPTQRCGTLAAGPTHPCRKSIRALLTAYPAISNVSLTISFRKVSRDRIQAAVDEYLRALSCSCPGLQILQLQLDLVSFNERKVRPPSLAALGRAPALHTLVLQESGWRSQQLRVDAPATFAALPALRTLRVMGRLDPNPKASWSRVDGLVLCTHLRCQLSQNQTAVEELARSLRALGRGVSSGSSNSSNGVLGTQGGGGNSHPSFASNGHSAVHLQGSSGNTGQYIRGHHHLTPAAASTAAATSASLFADAATTAAAAASITATTLEVLEETYAEAAVAAGALDLSPLPNCTRLTLLSGADKALAHASLELRGCSRLQHLTVCDVAAGAYAYCGHGHGIPSRLLSSPLHALTSLVLVGFVVNQPSDLSPLSALTTLLELRLEQPTVTSAGAASRDASPTGMLLHLLPKQLQILKLKQVALTAPPPLLTCALQCCQQQPLSTQDPQLAQPWSVLQHQQLQQPAALAQLSLQQPALPAVAATQPAASLIPSTSAIGSDSGSNRCPPGHLNVLQLLPNLRELHLSDCHLQHAFMTLGQCPLLTTLSLHNCNLLTASCRQLCDVAPALSSLSIAHTLPLYEQLSRLQAQSSASATAAPAAMHKAYCLDSDRLLSNEYLEQIAMGAPRLTRLQLHVCASAGLTAKGLRRLATGLQHLRELEICPAFSLGGQASVSDPCWPRSSRVCSDQLAAPSHAANASGAGQCLADVTIHHEVMLQLAAAPRLSELWLWIPPWQMGARGADWQAPGKGLQEALQAAMPHAVVEWTSVRGEPRDRIRDAYAESAIFHPF